MDEVYGRTDEIDDADAGTLKMLLESLADEFMAEFSLVGEGDFENYPDFPFAELPPRVVERERVVLGLRPIPSEKFRIGLRGPSPRSSLLETGKNALQASGLADKYEIAESGTTTIEIVRKNVSKSVAFADVIEKMARDLDLSSSHIEGSSIIVGDEFGFGGNDHALATEFPRTMCLSVGSNSTYDLPRNVVALGGRGTPATEKLSGYIYKVLVNAAQSVNL